MNSLEMTKRITAELGEQTSVKEVFAKAAALVKSEMQAGNAVDMFGLVRMQLTPGALKGEAKGSSAISAFPMPGLIPSKTTAESDEVKVAVVVESIDPFSKIIQKKLASEKREVVLVEGVQELMDVVKNDSFDAIVMDAAIDMSDDVRMWLKNDPKRSLISLIALYQSDEERTKNRLLQVCEDACLVEPYEMQTLGEMIDVEINRVKAEKKHFRHILSFDFPAEAKYQQLSADLIETVTRKSGLSEESRMGLVIAFREAVDNAIRHGSKASKEARVDVAYVLDHEKITVTITDEGAGFDSSMYFESKVSSDAASAARARHKEGRRGGLGIMLMLKSVDKLEYNREGNVAKITKFLRG